MQDLHGLAPNHRIWVEEGSEKLRIDRSDASAIEATSQCHRVGKEIETLPTIVETWLIVPVACPGFSLTRSCWRSAKSLYTSRKARAAEFLDREVSGLPERPQRAFEQLHSAGGNAHFQLLTLKRDDDARPG